MFSRRRGSSKTRPPVDNSTSNAATAAGQLAFLQHSGSTPALSSAAAAAALRSYTSTPEPVGSLQTKRIIRKGSVSSQTSGTGVVANGRPGLKRTNSSGSMTERTFRSPSPAQWNASSPSSDVPPVPALPQTINRPSSSLDAPQRVTSPTPAQGKRSSSLDGGGAVAGGPARLNKRLSNVAESDELDRAHSNFAKNFSRRDVSPLPASTAPSRYESQSAPGASKNYYTQGTDSWYTQDASARAPTRPKASEPSTRTSSMSSLTLSPVQPLKGTQPVYAAGRHYGQQRAYGSQSGTNDAQQTKVYDPNSRTFISKPVSQQQQQQPLQPALQAARRVKSTETVYDKNSRTFVPKYPQQYQNDSTASSPRSVASEPRKQRSFPAGSTSPEPLYRPNRFSSFAIVPSATSRTSAPLQKQPSMVREDAAAETRAEGTSYLPTEPTNGTRATQPTVLPPKTFGASSEKSQRSASLDVPRDASGRGRNVSHSPQRSAHFSPSPVLDPAKHAPPPRDISPAKSAMKQSPSMRPISPMAASETSETPSMSTLDGYPGKKKKSVRVSFDEHAQEIGPPAIALSSSLRPRSPEVVEDMDDDGTMKPRPALPSFGSVRRDRLQPAPAEKVTEMPPERHDEVSSDRALGGILMSSRDPLPPEVTSKESAGYVSDESSEADVPAVSAGVAESARMEDQKVPLTQAGEPKVVASDFAYVKAPESGVPDIAFVPPTPLLGDDAERSLDVADKTDQVDETRGRGSMEVFSVPGGWTDDVEKTATPPAPAPEVATPTPEPSISARRSSAEDSAATMTVTPIYVVKPPEPLSDIDETSDDSAAFSDAFEDPSDFEDEGGFRSLDAIVESPLPSPVETRTMPLDREVPESPTVKRTPKTPEIFDGSQPAVAPVVAQVGLPAASNEPSSPTPTGDWQQATTYWSQLSKERRAQIEREALSSDDEARAPPVASKKIKAKKTTASSADDSAALPTLRKTMRAQSGPTSVDSTPDDGAVHIRSSMRTGGTLKPAFRETSPSQRPQSAYTEPRGLSQKTAARPTSAGGPVAASAGAAKAVRPPPIKRFSDDSVYSQDTPVKKSPPRTRVEQPKVSARLQKELAKADESDSESSFKKRRKAATNGNNQGRYSMRKSMRGGTVDTVPVAVETIERRPESPSSDRAGRFGFRSLSPTFGRNKAASTRDSSQDSGMRTSLRAAQSKGGKQGSQVGGMKTSMRGATSNQAPSKQTTSMKSKIQSRFADSDDEDEAPRRTFFKSRFADSDDESDPGSPPPLPRPRAELTPVRGIPRRRGQEDGDSTDLEEEDDNNPAERASKRFTGLIGPHPASASTETDKVLAAARRNLGMGEGSSPTHDKEGEALQRGSLRQRPVVESSQTTTKPADISFAPPDKKKKGFMNSILRRNRQSSSSIPQVNSANSPARTPGSPVITPAMPQTPTQERPSSPQRTGTASSILSKQATTPSSPSGPPPGKLIRKESYQRWQQQNADSDDVHELPGSSPAGPHPGLMKLQERDLNEILLTLPESASSPGSPNVGARPATSDGFFAPSLSESVRKARPLPAQRSQSGSFVRRVQIQAGEEGSEPGEREGGSGLGMGAGKESKAVYSQKTGKKKKFGMLRRAFGLND